jgi:hypothetical protein
MGGNTGFQWADPFTASTSSVPPTVPEPDSILLLVTGLLGAVGMKERVEKPCLGVVPYLSSLMLDEEDSLGLRFTTQSHWTAEEVLNQLADANL